MKKWFKNLFYPNKLPKTYKLNGKYMIIHYVGIGNLSDKLPEDRKEHLISVGNLLNSDFVNTELSPAHAFLNEYIENNGIIFKHKDKNFIDLFEEKFITTRETSSRIELLKFN